MTFHETELMARTKLWEKLTELVGQFVEVMKREMGPGGGLEAPPPPEPKKEKR